MRERCLFALVGCLYSIVAVGDPPIGIYWIKSVDGKYDVFVNSPSHTVTVAEIWHDPLRKSAGRIAVNGKPLAFAPSRTNILWTASVTNTFLNFSQVFAVSNGTRIVVVCRLADTERYRPDLRAVCVVNKNGTTIGVDWRQFITDIVEIEPQNSEQERYHWLQTVGNVTDSELFLTNARGSTLVMNMDTGVIKWLELGPLEKRDPFRPPIEGRKDNDSQQTPAGDSSTRAARVSEPPEK